MAKYYMKSDGNGGIIIHKGLFALITFVVAMLTTFASIVAFSTALRSDVNHNNQQIQELTLIMSKYGERIQENNLNIVEMKSDIRNIQQNVEIIREDVQYLIKDKERKAP